jgi:hypothetical protein
MLRHRAIARRLAGVDPHRYIADVVPRFTGIVCLKDLPALLPSR